MSAIGFPKRPTGLSTSGVSELDRVDEVDNIAIRERLREHRASDWFKTKPKTCINFGFKAGGTAPWDRVTKARVDAALGHVRSVMSTLLGDV